VHRGRSSPGSPPASWSTSAAALNAAATAGAFVGPGVEVPQTEAHDAPPTNKLTVEPPTTIIVTPPAEENLVPPVSPPVLTPGTEATYTLLMSSPEASSEESSILSRQES